jgi:hypothetical protein
MTKKRRVYRPRFVGGKIMMQADLERLHKYTIGCRGHRPYLRRNASRCVYQKLRLGRSGDAVHRGEHVT